MLKIKLCAAVLAAACWFDMAAKSVRNPLHSIANAENRNVLQKHGGIAFWRVCGVNGIWPARKDDSRRFELADFVNGSGARQDGAEYFLLADAARDELRILPAKVQHDHAAALRLWLAVFFLHFRSSRHRMLLWHRI